MPVKISKNPNGTYRVSTPNAVHAKATSKKNALSQARLLNAVDHGWKPTGKKSPLKQKGVALSSFGPTKKRR